MALYAFGLSYYSRLPAVDTKTDHLTGETSESERRSVIVFSPPPEEMYIAAKDLLRTVYSEKLNTICLINGHFQV
jgi:hypothetical protein